jgi:hypothetical protein
LARSSRYNEERQNGFSHSILLATYFLLAKATHSCGDLKWRWPGAFHFSALGLAIIRWICVWRVMNHLFGYAPAISIEREVSGECPDAVRILPTH